MDTVISLHSSLQTCSSSVRLWGNQAFFKSRHTFSIALRSEVLHCWKIYILLSRSCLADWIWFSSRMSLYVAAFILISTFQAFQGLLLRSIPTAWFCHRGGDGVLVVRCSVFCLPDIAPSLMAKKPHFGLTRTKKPSSSWPWSLPHTFGWI